MLGRVIFAALCVLSSASSAVKRNDDVSLASVHTLVQQQAGTIQQQAAALTALTTRLTAAENTIQQQASTIQHQLTKINQQASSLHSLASRVSSAEHTIQGQATTIQHQAALLQQEQNKLTADEHTLHTQGVSIHTLQHQMTAVQAHQNKSVAFTATFHTAASSSHAVNIGTNGIIKFNHANTNKGGGYHTATGIFTAPVAGMYVFALSIQSDNASTHRANVEVTTNGNHRVCIAAAEGETYDHLDKGTCTAVVHLKAGGGNLRPLRQGYVHGGGAFEGGGRGVRATLLREHLHQPNVVHLAVRLPRARRLNRDCV